MTNVPATTQNNIHNIGHMTRATAQSDALPVVSKHPWRIGLTGLLNNHMFSWRTDSFNLRRRAWVWIYCQEQVFCSTLMHVTLKHSVFCFFKDTLCHTLMRLENSNIHNAVYNEVKYTHICLLIIMLKQKNSPAVCSTGSPAWIESQSNCYVN